MLWGRERASDSSGIRAGGPVSLCLFFSDLLSRAFSERMVKYRSRDDSSVPGDRDCDEQHGWSLKWSPVKWEWKPARVGWPVQKLFALQFGLVGISGVTRSSSSLGVLSCAPNVQFLMDLSTKITGFWRPTECWLTKLSTLLPLKVPNCTKSS